MDLLLPILTAFALIAMILWAIRRSKSTGALDKAVETEVTKAPTVRKSDPHVDALILGYLEEPLLEFYPASRSAESTPVPMTPGLMAAVEPLLQRAPAVFQTGRELADMSYRVIFSPAVTRSLRNNSMELLPSSGELLPVARSMAKGKKFVEIGKVVKGSGIKLAGVATMSWQVLSIATAQHYLNEINARLAGIEGGIKDIQAWLHEDKKGQLQASAGYLKEVANAIRRGIMHPDEVRSLYAKLDDVEVVARGIGEMAREMSKRRILDLDKLSIDDWFDRGGSAERVRGWLRHNREVLDLLLLAQGIRLLCCQVRALLPGDYERIRERMADIQAQMIEAETLFKKVAAAFNEKIRGLSKRQGNLIALDGAFDDDYRKGLEGEFKTLLDYLQQAAKRFDSESAAALHMQHQLDALAEKGMELEIRRSSDGEMQVLLPKSQTS
jgi:hypothetical protein